MPASQDESDAMNEVRTRTERTPLLAREEGEAKLPLRGRRGLYYALLCAFLVSLSFGVTQVPILYVFRLMTCDAYYERHLVPDSPIDRCSRREIEARTAREIALLGGSTTIFGLVNLLVTGWTIKRLGVKRALQIQVFWPAVRLLIQNIGVMTGSNAGILIVQASQIITIVGGPNGYVLALNSFITDVVTHDERTGALGKLQGCMMVGAAVGFLLGGLIGDAFSILAPFRITLILFLLCSIYVAFVIPSIPRDQDTAAASQKLGLVRFIGPLRIFAPQKWSLSDGRIARQFGALTLGVGVFLGILATGYIPTLLQLYSTNEFGFGTADNAWLVFVYSTLRGLFLSLVFPGIIARGRIWLQPDHNSSPWKPPEQNPAQDEPTLPNEIGPIDPIDNDREPAQPGPPKNEKQTFEFDLLYARCSLLADGILTGCALFVTQGWQLYIIALVLPLSAGTGAASKGTILQMLPSKERVDALSGITLIENIARLATTAVFGLVFAALAEVGKSRLTFTVNAGVALLGFIVLLFSRFPPKGSTRAGD